MNYWKVILVTVVIFGTGVFTGGLLVNFVDHPHLKSPRHSQANIETRPLEKIDQTQRLPEIPPPRIAEKMGKQFVQQLNDKLQLTPEQREKIEKIIADGQQHNHIIWTNAAAEIRTVIQEVNQQIRAELKPTQLKPFEELLKHPQRRSSAGTNAPPANAPLTNAPDI